MKWPVVKLCEAQLQDVNKSDILNDGLYRKCKALLKYSIDESSETRSVLGRAYIDIHSIRPRWDCLDAIINGVL